MKKMIILLTVVLLMVSFSVLSFGDDEVIESRSPLQVVVTKTYVLKHISPQTVDKALRIYFYEASFERNGNMIAVKMPDTNVEKFEALLKKMDVEKKKIMIRIFTIIASNKGSGADIKNRDLKQVLTELKNVLSFKSFRLDGVSAVTVTEAQERRTQLVLSTSGLPLKLQMNNISLKEDQQGLHNIGFSFKLEQQKYNTGPDDYRTLIASETYVKENGYLVAGVSKTGKNGDSLVLVINAEIK